MDKYAQMEKIAEFAHEVYELTPDQIDELGLWDEINDLMELDEMLKEAGAKTKAIGRWWGRGLGARLEAPPDTPFSLRRGLESFGKLTGNPRKGLGGQMREVGEAAPGRAGEFYREYGKGIVEGRHKVRKIKKGIKSGIKTRLGLKHQEDSNLGRFLGKLTKKAPVK
jgi:hypothetical protein